MSEAIEFTVDTGPRPCVETMTLVVPDFELVSVLAWTYIELPMEDVDRLVDFLNSQVDSYG